LTYLAGDNDEKVTFHARFQPKNFSEYVQDITSIEVVRSTVTAKITYIKNRTRDFSETKSDWWHVTEQSNTNENIKFTIYLTCEKKPEIDYILDKKSFKMKIRYYTYQIKSARIQSALYEGQSSTYKKSIDSVGLRSEYSCKYSWIGTDFQLTPQNSMPTIGIRIDPANGNIKRVHLPHYNVTGTVNHKSDCKGVKMESRKEWRYDYKLVPFNDQKESSSDLTISLQPNVHDQEECSKVADDKNKKFLRGECSQIRKGKYQTEEETYKWEVTIRKNK
jgi:hypothetical protein